MTEAIERVAHDGGDNAIINHCPFCGSGAVVGRSDGSAQCGFCHTTFTVQVQPQYPNAPQTIDGNPNQIPGMPGEQPTEMSRPTDPAVPPDKPQETTLPAGTPAPNDANATPDSADGAKPPEKKKNLPPWLKNKASSRTAVQWREVFDPEDLTQAEIDFLDGQVSSDADERHDIERYLEQFRSGANERVDAGTCVNCGEPLWHYPGGAFLFGTSGERCPAAQPGWVGHVSSTVGRDPRQASAMFVTAQGVALDEDSYVRHLAIHNADDKAAVLTQVRAENG